jgi:hypothetical protein
MTTTTTTTTESVEEVVRGERNWEGQGPCVCTSFTLLVYLKVE